MPLRGANLLTESNRTEQLLANHQLKSGLKVLLPPLTAEQLRE
jgi:hypothetical protein